MGPNKTAFDVASELCEKVKMRSDELIIKEVVLDGKLHRPVHHTEKVNFLHTTFKYKLCISINNLIILKPKYILSHI